MPYFGIAELLLKIIREFYMSILRYSVLFFCVSLFYTSISIAETLFVTDRILLGIHSEAAEESPLIDSVPSGTAVEVIETAGAFKKVRLPSGKAGWVSSGYLVADKPASAQVDQLVAKQQKQEAELKAVKAELNTVKAKLKKSNREIQVRRDQLSNARTTIEELKKKNGTAVPQVDTRMAEELAAANQEVENLKQKIAQLESSQPAKVTVSEADRDLAERMKKLEEENFALQGRIDMAQAHLTGKKVPLPEELALLDPPLPSWMWSVLVLMVIIGVIIGVGWMDHRHRRRHGGFRV